jgi:hypothetical protein
MELVGFRSRHAVYRLVTADLVTKDPQGKLIPHTHHTDVPILGIVEAGFPSPAEEEISDTMSLDESLIENSEGTPASWRGQLRCAARGVATELRQQRQEVLRCHQPALREFENLQRWLVDLRVRRGDTLC